MVLGISGVYGAMKTNKKEKTSGNCFLFLYLVGVFVFLALFVSATIFFFVGPETIFKNDCTSGAKIDIVDQLYNLSVKANKEFCTNDCPCYLNSTNTNSYLADQLKNKPNFNFSSTNPAHKHYQICMPVEEQKSSNVLLLGALEELLGCGGWCPSDEPKHYKFYDINLCVSKGNLFLI